MKKAYTHNGKYCKVTFEMPKDVAAESIAVCGDFNDWQQDKHILVKRKDGRFSISVSLKAGAEYRFRYLINGTRWENDWNAEKYLPNEYGTKDSVVVT